MAKVKVLIGPIDNFNEGDEMEIAEGATLEYFLNAKFVERLDDEDDEKPKAKGKAKSTSTTDPSTATAE